MPCFFRYGAFCSVHLLRQHQGIQQKATFCSSHYFSYYRTFQKNIILGLQALHRLSGELFLISHHFYNILAVPKV